MFDFWWFSLKLLWWITIYVNRILTSIYESINNFCVMSQNIYFSRANFSRRLIHNIRINPKLYKLVLTFYNFCMKFFFLNKEEMNYESLKASHIVGIFWIPFIQAIILWVSESKAVICIKSRAYDFLAFLSLSSAHNDMHAEI